MHRRRYLAALGASALPLAGCTSLAADGSGGPTSTPETTTRDGPPLRRVEVVETDAPAWLDLDLQVTRQVTEDHFGGAELELRNVGDEKRDVAWQFDFFMCRTDTESGSDVGLVLMNESNLITDRQSPACPEPALTEGGGFWGDDAGAGPIPLLAGERFTEQYLVFGHPEFPGCMAPGEYRYPGEDGRDEFPDGDPFPWSVALSVEAPRAAESTTTA